MAIKYKIRDGIIYIQTSPSDKKYIGQTINQPMRFKKYKSHCGNNPHHTNALCLYGYSAFTIQIFKVPEFLLNAVEKSLIKYYQTTDPSKGYNKKEGGANGRPTKETKNKIRNSTLGKKNHFFGKTHTKDAKRRIGIAHLGNTYRVGIKHTKEANKKNRDAHIGKIHTKEAREKNRDAHLGKKNHFFGKTHTKESKIKMRNARLGKTAIEKTKIKMRDAHLGKKNHFFGKKHTEEANKKNRDAHLGNTYRIGKKHTEETINKLSKKICIYGIIYNSSKKASDALRFLYGFKSNFIQKWVNSPKYPDIFYIS